MSRALLDVNVLVALLDRGHISHDRAREWLSQEIDLGWASCAITQNGVVRIMSQTSYPHHVSTRDAIELLAHACATDYHQYWPCQVSVADAGAVDPSRVHGPRQVTDAYLLALAVAQGGRFVTLDQSVPLSAVPHATAEHLVVL